MRHHRFEWLGLGTIVVALLAAGCGASEDASLFPDEQKAPPDAVEVVRDEYGIPHIQATTLPGAMHGLGYASAQDRLLQMELKRRVMRGHMAEVFGPDWLATDVQNRTMGYARHADAIVPVLPEAERATLEAYADGVNAYVESDGFVLPEDFATAGIAAFDPWTAQDCLLSWDFLSNFFIADAVDGIIEQEIGPIPTSDCPQPIDEDAPIVPNPMMASIMGAEPLRQHPAMKASHSWVIAGSRNSEGAAAVLHANPQFTVMAPSWVYEYHLSTPDLDVRGAGFSGHPGFLVFFNRHIAIGGSGAFADPADLFELQVSAGGYVVDGETKPFVEHQETVEVLGAAPVSFVARESQFGPVVSDFHEGMNGTYSMRHAELYRQDSHTLVGALRMMQANNLEEYRAGIAHWGHVCIHTIYGDDEGNIAYQPACLVAKRATDLNPNPGLQPFDGSVGSQDWQGFLDVDTMPHVINPEEGYIFTANHPAVGSWYPYYTGLTGPGDRARSQRLRAIFEHLLPDEAAKLAPDEVRAIQDDAGSEVVRVFVLALEQLDALGRLEQPSGDPTTAAQKAWLVLDAFHRWGEAPGAATEVYPGLQLVTTDSYYPLLEWIASQMPLFWRFDVPGQPPNPIQCTYGGGEAGLAYWQKAFVEDPNALMSDFSDPAHVVAMQAHLDAAAGAYDTLTNSLGWRPDEWSTPPREYHVPHQFNFMCLQNALSCDLQQCLDVDAAPCSLDGDKSFTAELTVPWHATLRSQSGNGYSHWVDLGDVDGALSLTPPGVSEDASSSFFAEALDAWETNQMRPAPLSLAGAVAPK